MRYVHLFCLAALAFAVAVAGLAVANLATVTAQTESSNKVQGQATTIYFAEGTYHVIEAPGTWYRRWEIWTAIALGVSLAVNAYFITWRYLSWRFPCLLCLVLLPAVAWAEPFEVWDDTGIIYSRDLATGEELRLSSWGGGCSQPDVDGLLAVWLDPRIGKPAIYGYWLSNPSPTPRDGIYAHSEFSMSEPHAGWIGDYRNEWAYVVWREGGDIWHNPMRWHAQGDYPIKSIVLEDYSGAFDVNGRTLSYDGGTLNLNDFVVYPDPVPEPGTLLMLVVGLLCAVWHINSRRG